MLTSTLVKAIFCAALAATVAASAQTMDTPAQSALNRTDLQIVASMARANMSEIEAGKLALANGHGAAVKTFAQRMIDDHTRALKDVIALAQNKGVALPGAPDAKHKAMAARLSRLKGERFDQAYMKQAGVADHKQVYAMLKKGHARATDRDVKALAAKMLLTVEQHLHAAGEKVDVGYTGK